MPVHGSRIAKPAIAGCCRLAGGEGAGDLVVVLAHEMFLRDESPLGGRLVVRQPAPGCQTLVWITVGGVELVPSPTGQIRSGGLISKVSCSGPDWRPWARVRTPEGTIRLGGRYCCYCRTS